MMPQGQAELNSPIWSKGKWGEKREKGSCVNSQMKRPRPIAEARVFDISKLFKHSVAMYFPIELKAVPIISKSQIPPRYWPALVL